MRDDFEKELQDVLSGFDRKPELGSWRMIKGRIQGNAVPLIRPSYFVWGIVVILLGAWLWFEQQPNFPKKQSIQPTSQSKEFIRIDTTYSIDRKGKETMSIDTVFFDTAIFALYKKGEQLYKKCSVCHATDMVTRATGPALGGVTKIRSRDWLYDFTRNSQRMIAAQDPIALELWDKWKPAVMTSFPDLTDNDLEAIYAYIDIKTPGNFVPESGKQ